MEISPSCGRTLLSKDEALWNIKEFVIDSVWKYYSASSLPYSQEKRNCFPFSGSSQLVALFQCSSFFSPTVSRFLYPQEQNS